MNQADQFDCRDKLTGDQGCPDFAEAKPAGPTGPAPIEPELVLVHGGAFMMGLPLSETDAYKPQEPKTVSAFYIGKHEVTWNEYDQCIAANACPAAGDESDAGGGKGRRLVISVSWQDAKAYADWLSKETHRAYRLLTEIEWEYPADAGSNTLYPWGSSWDRSKANGGGSVGKTQTVGSYPANAWGIHDMIGNVWEWVSDCDEKDCSLHVSRGGGWDAEPRYLRSAEKSSGSSRNYNAGFRLARTG